MCPAAVYPVLYSFRRCPYAMRARLALYASGVRVELREVVLRAKPEAMLTLSPKATVPVLQAPDGLVIDESLDVMYWALHTNDPQSWLSDLNDGSRVLIEENDSSFKQALDRYKYADRFPEHPQETYRQQGEVFIQKLEEILATYKQPYLFSEQPRLVDMAILPFVRQFAHVDRQWFDGAPYHSVRLWLDQFLNSDIFSAIMKKYPAWQPADERLLWGREEVL